MVVLWWFCVSRKLSNILIANNLHQNRVGSSKTYQIFLNNMVSHIKTAMGLEKLRQQLAAFYAKQIDEEMDALWESGQFDEKRLQELRGSHFRTPYKK